MAKGRKRDSTAEEDTGRKEKKTRRAMAEQDPEPVEDVEAENSEEEAEKLEGVDMAPTRMKAKRNDGDSESKLVGDPVPMEEAKQKWPRRYQVIIRFLSFLVFSSICFSF